MRKILLSSLIGVALFSVTSARACTVFCYSQGDVAFAAYSFDVPDDPGFGLQFVPATATTHGWVGGGRFELPFGPWSGGMNDQGLFFAVADVPTPADHATKSSRKPVDLQTFVSNLLGNCASVDEAIRWCRKQPTPHLYGWINQDSHGDYTFDTAGHILVADRSGDSVVFEWYHGKLKTTRKRGRYQLMTNFLLSDPEAGAYPCPRFNADRRILDRATGPDLQTCRQVLETTAQGCTRISLVCDLKRGDVHVYFRQRFDQPKTFRLADELKEGRHELDLDKWFGWPKPKPLSPPPVIARSTLPAAGILQRALEVRGGEKAAAKIRSIHGKGTVDKTDMVCLRALPTEYSAMRPNRYRWVLDICPPAGPDLGRYVEGFDGRIGWNINPGSSCQILRGKQYDQRKDSAGFFGWYEKPGVYASAECLGEARFAGKLCYDLKVVSKTHNEYFEYYDTTNFLFAGSFSRLPDGSGWEITTFSDYRSFDGFLMPMRGEWRDDSGGGSLQFSSMEINTVTNISPAPVLAHLDSKTYDQYVGQYRKALLFGLVHLGPTLSISYAADKLLGHHLVASARGLPQAPGNNSGNFFPMKANSFSIDPEITDDKIDLTFGRLRNGKATRVIVNWNGKILSGVRISDKPAG